MKLEGLKWDKAHGFQREPGFTVDKVVGRLEILVIECHSDRSPNVKQRFVMPVPSTPEKARVHDYGFIGRSEGKVVVHDRWSLARAKGVRLIGLLGKIFVKIIGKARKKLEDELFTW